MKRLVKILGAAVLTMFVAIVVVLAALYSTLCTGHPRGVRGGGHGHGPGRQE